MDDGYEGAARHVRRAIEAASDPRRDGSGLSRLSGLCEAAVVELDLSCATVSMVTDLGPMVIARSAGTLGPALADLQVASGEGPTFDAAREHRPALSGNLAAEGRTRWTEFAGAATRAGCRAIWAFPLGVGAARLGVLEMSFTSIQTMVAHRTRSALTFAEVATETILDIEGGRGDAARQTDIARVVDLRAEVYQAQGIIMVSLDTTATDALVRMRAVAFANDLDLASLASSIVNGTVTLDDAS